MSSVRQELFILGRYAAPIVATQVGVMMMGVVDAWMVGKLGKEALAGVALGDLWIMGTSVVGMGILLGIDPIVTQAHGSGDGKSAALALQRGVLLAVALSIPLGLSWYYTKEVLEFAGQKPLLAAGAQTYTDVQVFSLAPFYIYIVLRQYLVGRTLMLPALWVVLIANLVNVFLNWLLIFGNLGFPELGIRGAGLATGLTRVMMMVSLAGWILLFRLHRGAWTPWTRDVLNLRGLWRILVLGFPVGAQIGLEVWAFALALLMAGLLGEDAVAGHFIVIRLASLAFMVPLGISIALCTRVGNLLGAGEPRRAQQASWIGLGMGAGVMTLSALVFILFRHELPEQFNQSPEVISLCASILPIAAAFQIFDGTQVVGCGILRGMGRTLPAALFNFLGYYLLALPLSFWLTFSVGLGLRGIWWGLCLGLGVVAALLLVWIGRRGPANCPPVAGSPVTART